MPCVRSSLMLGCWRLPKTSNVKSYEQNVGFHTQFAVILFLKRSSVWCRQWNALWWCNRTEHSAWKCSLNYDNGYDDVDGGDGVGGAGVTTVMTPLLLPLAFIRMRYVQHLMVCSRGKYCYRTFKFRSFAISRVASIGMHATWTYCVLNHMGFRLKIYFLVFSRYINWLMCL